MLFVEPRFFAFFAVVLTVYWTLRSNDARKWFLLVASYYFYGSWDWRFAAMLLALSTADWYLGVRIASSTDTRARKRFVTASASMNLVVLAFFKYFHFFTASTAALARAAHVHLDEPTLHIILPVGISFFTFQSLSYTIDVYRSEIPPVTSLRDYLMLSSFFPQLVAGPIVRPRFFVPQLGTRRHVNLDDVKAMLYLFLLGFFKKQCLADNLSPYVDAVFANPTHYSAMSSVIAAWLYALQIFCDFSGYSDMAVAVAGLMGYKLVLNFDAPYLAVSIQDFWRRWHISLSTWIRDYIYISLGGSRGKTRWFTYRNLMITMLAGGLWHGAAWTFVAWGGAHGAAQVVHSEVKRIAPVKPAQRRWRDLVGWLLTMQFVCLCWILFRAPTFSEAWVVIRQYLFLSRGGAQSLPVWLALIPPALLLGQYAMRRAAVEAHAVRLNLPWFGAAYGAAWALVISLLPLGYRPFIYFQF